MAAVNTQNIINVGITDYTYATNDTSYNQEIAYTTPDINNWPMYVMTVEY